MTLYFQGLAYDHVELDFYLNGKPLGCPMMGIKGTVPSLYTAAPSFKYYVQFTPSLQHNILAYMLYFQGLAYDHVELNFYLNGKPLGCPMMGIKGTIYPIFYGKHFFYHLFKKIR